MLSGVARMSTPGYYKVNYRALSLTGVARMWGPLRLPLAFFITRFKQPTATAWMPTLWTGLECTKQDLSARFWQTTLRHREEFERLGFTEFGLKRVKQILSPFHRDNGGVNYLDVSGCHFGQLVCKRIHVPTPAR